MDEWSFLPNYNFEQINNGLIKTIEEYFTVFPPDEKAADKPGLTLVLAGSASAPNTRSYNIPLSKRRISSVENYLKQNPIKLDNFWNQCICPRLQRHNFRQLNKLSYSIC